MKPMICRLILVASLIMLRNVTPSWGQGQTPVCSVPGCNPTASDSNRSTAGDTGALNIVYETVQGGVDNTAFGFYALLLNTSGGKNTAVGGKTLQNSLGTKNTGIGFQAGATLTNGNNNIYIANQGAGDESQTIRIGTAQAQTFIAGISRIHRRDRRGPTKTHTQRRTAVLRY
jgi:hypothetical protein